MWEMTCCPNDGLAFRICELIEVLWMSERDRNSFDVHFWMLDFIFCDLSFTFSFAFISPLFRHHGSLSTCSSGGIPPLTSPPPRPFLHLSLYLTYPLPVNPTPYKPPTARASSWQERRARTSGASWISSAWRASSREGRVACWWLTAGHFLSTTLRTCKVRSTFATPSWWRGDCSRTRCPSLSCCNPTARWRWVTAPHPLMLAGWFMGEGLVFVVSFLFTS